MKRIVFVLLAVVMAIFAGCQKTPESPIIVGKEMGAFLEKTQPPTQVDVPIRERIGSPKTYQREIKDERIEKLTITVDAVVDVPDVSSIPMVYVYAADFTQETVSMMFRRLCENYDMMDRPAIMTKSQIERQLISLKQLLDSPNLTDPEIMKQNITAEINRLEQLYPTAPETVSLTLSEGMLTDIHVDNYLTGASYNYMGVEAYDAQKEAHFFVRNNDDLKQSVIIGEKDENGNIIGGTGTIVQRRASIDLLTALGMSNFTQHPMIKIEDMAVVPMQAQGYLSITPKEAIELVEEVLAGTGMAAKHIFLTDNENTGSYDGKISPAENYAYRVYCTRRVADIDIAYLDGSAVPEGGGFAPRWDYERMDILINDDGVISFSWTSPHEMGEVLAQDVSLLDFEQVMRVFESIMPIIASEGIEFYSDAEIEIDHIKLEFQRVIEKNSIEKGILIPVWNFYGIKKITYLDGDFFDDNYGLQAPKNLVSINAIDGSIIDVERGY